jgi:hypothetical protein
MFLNPKARICVCGIAIQFSQGRISVIWNQSRLADQWLGAKQCHATLTSFFSRLVIVSVLVVICSRETARRRMHDAVDEPTLFLRTADFDDRDVRHRNISGRLRFWLGHDGTSFRPTATVAAVGDSETHRAQARRGLHRVRLGAPSIIAARHQSRCAKAHLMPGSVGWNPASGDGRLRCGGAIQRHQPAAGIVTQAADHRGHAAQSGLRTGAAGLAQRDELRRDFDDQDVRHRDIGSRLRFGLGHDRTPFRPTPGVDAVGESNPHRAQARQGLRSNSPRP